MDRKGIIAVSLAIIVMIVWQIVYAPKLVPPPPPAKPAAAVSPAPGAENTADTAHAAAAPTAAPATASAPAPAPAAAPEPKVAESLQKIATGAVEYSFTNLGGGIARAVLQKHLGENEKSVELNEFGELPIGATSEQPGENATLPFSVTADSAAGVTCERTEANGVQIVKKFTLPQSDKAAEEYLVKLDVSFTNRGAQPYQSGGYYVYTGSAAPAHQRDSPIYTGFDWMHGGKATFIDVNWFSAGRVPVVGVQTHAERPVYAQSAEGIAWAGVTSQYFTTIVTPAEAKASRVWARRFEIDLEKRSRADAGANPAAMHALEGAIGMPGFTLAPGQTVTQSFQIYAGPKLYHALKKLGHGEDAIMNFGKFGFISKLLLSFMNWLHSLTGSYAVAIIVLTICVRGVMWPLQNRATQSMKSMQALQPKMAELREKYKDDPTRMNQELMKIYKDYDVNPVSGCLPMFIQIPIFFGLFSMLGTAVELRGSHFLWVHDLSQPDTIAHLPGLGWPINILPLCMAATMLVQMQLTPRSGDQMQQRLMMFMPLIFIVFCYNFASALALYYTMQNLFSIVQLYVTRDAPAPALHKVSTASAARKKR